MRRFVLAAAASLAVATHASLAMTAREAMPQFELGVPPPASASDLWFDVGETMHYGIYWGIFGVGSTEVTTQWVKDEDGRTLLLIRFETHSNSVIEKIYPITDIQESIIDPETFLPLYFYKNSKQGKREYDELVTFDHGKRKAYWKSYNKNRAKEIDIDPDSRDIISMMYFLRQTEPTVGDEKKYRVYTDEKLYDLVVTGEERDEVKTDRYGKISTVKLEPKAKFDGLFVRKGRIFMWISDDARRICAKVQAKLPVASVKILIKDVEGPGADFWITQKEDDDSEDGRRMRHPRR